VGCACGPAQSTAQNPAQAATKIHNKVRSGQTGAWQGCGQVAVKYLLDTDTLSFVARGEHPRLTQRVLNCAPEDLALSVISRGEVEFGLQAAPPRRDTERRMRGLLVNVQCLPLSEDVALEYAEIRSTLQHAGTLIGINDTWIAAHARCLGLTVVTHNTREFSRVAGLKIEDWVG
jgi:tRNA(fMet)-specific endonuclease VapC